MLRDEDGGYKFNNITLQSRLSFVVEKLQFL